MYEMVKKIIGAWPPGEGCWPPTAGPHPEQRPLSRRRGPAASLAPRFCDFPLLCRAMRHCGDGAYGTRWSGWTPKTVQGIFLTQGSNLGLPYSRFRSDKSGLLYLGTSQFGKAGKK